MINSVLIIPDAHCGPNIPNTRFEWLSKLILAEKPEYIIIMGDFWDMFSLSDYEKGKKSFWKANYAKDVEAGVDALDRLHSPITKYIRTRKQGALRSYNPKFVFLTGNHEARLDKVLQVEPRLEGTLSYSDLKLDEFGYEVYPFKQPYILENVAFCHFFPSGDMGRPIGGDNLATKLLNVNHMSSTVGHSHLLDMAVRSKPDGSRIHGLSSGCFIEKELVHDYAKAVVRRWWSGVILKRRLCNGSYDPVFISYSQLKSDYSS